MTGMQKWQQWFRLVVVVMLTVAPLTINLVECQASQEGIVGVNYGPFRDGQSPLTGVYPTTAQIQEDMPILKRIAPYIRTFSVTNVSEEIPGLAKQAGLKVVPTAWLGRDLNANEAEIAKLISVANQNDNVAFVAVGSEVLLRGDLTKAKLIEHINYVKQRVSVPVTTGEPWHIWRDNPDLANAVDLIFINVYPYWERQPIETAVAYVLQRYNEIKTLYPNKRVIISETGWPSGGDAQGPAVPSLTNQKRFIQELMVKAIEQGIEFFLFEAFDEKWKKDVEGEVGAHWGFYTSQRSPKHDFTSIEIHPLTIGQPLPDQKLSWEGDARWYQVPIIKDQKVFVLLDKASNLSL